MTMRLDSLLGYGALFGAARALDCSPSAIQAVLPSNASVNFAYPGRPDIKVLDDVSLVFPAGKMTAIVGPSGSGKSTIVSLIERWYELDGDMVTNPMVRSITSSLVLSHGTCADAP